MRCSCSSRWSAVTGMWWKPRRTALRQRREVGMVGDHAGDLHRQLPAVHAEQDVVEAMPLPAHQHHQASRGVLRVIANASSGWKRACNASTETSSGRSVHAQEEAAGLLVAELLGVKDVAAGIEQQPGDAVDDAGGVRGTRA